MSFPPPEFWKDILDNSSDSSSDASDGFSSPTQNSVLPLHCTVTGYLLVTLNHPRTPAFNAATTEIQKQMYRKILNKMPTVLIGPKNALYLENVDSVFEYCKSGAVHYHSLIRVKSDMPFSIAGIVNDYVKHWLTHLPKQHRQYKEAYFKHEFQRYRSPSICVQYKTNDDPYIDEWVTYLHKEEYNKKN